MLWSKGNLARTLGLHQVQSRPVPEEHALLLSVLHAGRSIIPI